MKITPGELYFVGEEDLIDGTLTPLVKIGLVRENEDRTSEERAREHQTGNPRHLRVLHVQPSPAVREIEKVLHAEFAPSRIGGEWFHLPGAELEMAIERATVYIEEAKESWPALQASEDLKAKTSNGQSLTPDAATLGLHRRLLDVRKQQDAAKKAQEEIKQALIEAMEEAAEGSPYIKIKAPSKKFNRAAFTTAHPELAERYTVEKHRFSRRFNTSGLRGHVSDIPRDNPKLSEHLATVHESLEAGDPASVLHLQYLELLALWGPLDWERDLLEAGLQAACQKYDEIADVCTWPSSSSTTSRLDTTALESEEAEIYKQFLSEEERGVREVVKDLGYRLPPG
ncbi:MAG: hypothetical protein CL406_08155 [Acidimicrobiaceae bacterium]|jgi:hypothetical protein|nr:hypothetical protein [Acidimicrobiaceae bacterium]|tara:strand:+ start:338 stop:1363 length:1026 start_codon:yes stop_codon:yes gene_type:complete